MDNMKKCCFNCAYCSEHYPSMKDTCNQDEHIIVDVEREYCSNFMEVQDGQ